jgi:Glycosyl hydrolase family 79 C-terminal beta domain
MKRHGSRLGLLVVVVLGLLPGIAFAQGSVNATVSTSPTGAALPSGFLGLSLEYKALHIYIGRNPKAVDPVFLQLVKNLNPGQPPILRIGGDSTDATWWPIHGVIPPGGISYGLTPGWLETTRSLASDLNAKLILGVNLAAGRPAFAAAEGRAFVQGIGRKYIDAIEIGNEPDVYNEFVWYADRRGHVYFARPPDWDLTRFISQFSSWRSALPSTPLAGPAFAELSWLGGLDRFISAEPGLAIITLHRYPLHGCDTNPNSPSYASTTNMLSDAAAAGIAQQVAPYVTMAHQQSLQFRVDEMNSAAVASCLGRKGASDSFASALWVLDTLFNMASVGVDGVNLHTLPQAAYELFTFTETHNHWHAFVHPEYYGMLMFAQAFPPGAKLLPVTAPTGPLKVWATETSTGTIHVVLINKDQKHSYQVSLHIPGTISPATLGWLKAPRVTSTSGVTLDGQTFGSNTNSGLPTGTVQHTTVSPSLLTGNYTVTVPAASAAVLTP